MVFMAQLGAATWRYPMRALPLNLTDVMEMVGTALNVTFNEWSRRNNTLLRSPIAKRDRSAMFGSSCRRRRRCAWLRQAQRILTIISVVDVIIFSLSAILLSPTNETKHTRTG